MGNYFQGGREGGQDWGVYSFDSASDLTPSGGVAVLSYGVNVINYSGVGGIGAVLPSGVDLSNPFIYVKNAASGTVTISGSTANTYTINGNTSYTVTAGANIHLFNYSGNSANAIPVNYITL